MTNEKINELKYSFIPLTSNVATKAIFHFDENITKEILSILLGIDVEKVEYLENEISEKNAYEYISATYLTLLVNDKLYVNIDAGVKIFEKGMIKSLSRYIPHLLLRITKDEELKNPENDIIQININEFAQQNKNPEKKVKLFFKEDEELLADNILIKLYDIEKFRELYYNNNIDKKTNLLALFGAKSINELYETLKTLLNEEESELFKEKYLDMCCDPHVISAYEKEQIDKMLYYRAIEKCNS